MAGLPPSLGLGREQNRERRKEGRRGGGREGGTEGGREGGREGGEGREGGRKREGHCVTETPKEYQHEPHHAFEPGEDRLDFAQQRTKNID